MTDLLIHGARIRTMAAGATRQSPAATALAVTDGRITAVGTDDEILALAVHGRSEVIDAAGATLTPGLIDSHMHPVWGAELTEGVDLGGLEDLGVVRAAVAAAAQDLPPDAWVRGWNLEYRVFPDGIHGALLDEAAGRHPVALMFMDLHTAVANGAALSVAGIGGTEQFADASAVVVDEAGHPTGELREMPAYLRLLDAAPPQDREVILQRIQDTLAGAAATGITRAAVMDGRPVTLELLDGVERLPGGLPVHLQIAMWHQPGDDDDRVRERIGYLGRTGERYAVSMVKMFIDGVIDTGTAWLHEPDMLGGSTVPFWRSVERYEQVTRRYHEAGFQLATHSCGDAGAAQALRVYRALGTPAANGAAHRIEHLETLTDDDVTELAATGTVASMQPLHMQWREPDHSDSWAVRLGAERCAHAFRAKDILDAGGHLVLGSDWPVAQYDARLGMAWARLRRQPGRPDAPVFEPEQRLDGEQALLGYTRWAAEALGLPDVGVIAPGAVADLALWESDPVDTEADLLITTRVLLTTVGGVVTHREERT